MSALLTACIQHAVTNVVLNAHSILKLFCSTFCQITIKKGCIPAFLASMQPMFYRSTREGGNVRHKQPALTNQEFQAILHSIDTNAGIDSMSFTLRKFIAFSFMLCLRGRAEHHELRMQDFHLQIQPDGSKVLIFQSQISQKNWQGGRNDKMEPVCHNDLKPDAQCMQADFLPLAR